MKNIFKKTTLLIVTFINIVSFAQTTYTWNGSVSTDWNTSSNWTPAGIPIATDHIVVVTAPNNLTLSTNKNITNFTINSGIIDLNGFELTTSGNVALNDGTINGGTSGKLICNTGDVTVGTASTGITVNTRFNAQVPSITVRNSTFNDSTIIYKTTAASGNDNWRGGNTFNGYFYLENQSNYNIQLGANNIDPADVFNALSEFRISGDCLIRVRAYGNVTFNNIVKFYCDQNYFTTNTSDRIIISGLSSSSAIFNDSTFFYLTGNNYNDIEVAIQLGTSATFNGPTLIYRLNNNNNQSNLIFGANGGGSINFNNNVYFFNGTTSRIIIRNSTMASGFSYNANPTDFSSGELYIEYSQQLGATTQTLNLSNTSLLSLSNNVWNGVVNFSTGRIVTRNSSYNNITTLAKTGSGNDVSEGGNTFNGTTTLIKSASSTGGLYMGNTYPDTFNGLLYLKNYANAERIILCNNSSGNSFNNDIEFESSTTSSGIWIGNSAGSSSTLASGKVMTIGTAGFTSGDLRFYNFTQLGTAAQNLTITGTGYIQSRASTWNGPTQFIAPRVYITNTTHNNTAYWEKTGAGNDISTGGNIFNGTTTLVKSASSTGYFLMGENNPDTFNGLLRIKNYGTAERIILASNSTGNIFNDDIEFESTSTSGGIWFGDIGSSTLASGKVMTIGAAGFTSGDLRFYNFTQLGTAAQNLTITSTGYIQSRASTWNGPTQFIAPRVYITNTTHNNTAYWEKTGVVSDGSAGGNTFNDTTTFVKSASSTGGLFMGNTYPDTFNGLLRIKNYGTAERIILASNSTGNIFNDDIEFESTSTSGGIWFGDIGSSTLAPGKVMTIGAAGFTSGDLRFYNFTQLGTAAQNLTITGTGYIQSRASTWNGPTQFIAPRVYITNTTHNNTAYWEKTGSGNDASAGGNTFNGLTTLVKSASTTGYFLMGQTNPDIFNGLLRVKNYGTAERIILASNSIGNLFNDDIEFESGSTSGGIWFGNIGSSTLASGKVMMIGTAGFTSGDLRFYNFTQLGTAAQNLTITGTGYIQSRASTWNGPTQFIAPRVYITNTTHNNTAYWEKTGANSDVSPGGNIFNGITTLSNTGSGIFRMSTNFGTPDIYNNDVIWKRTGTGELQISHNNAENYYGNISFDGTQTITAAQGTNGRVVLTGTNNQIINKIGTNPQCRITRLEINKSSNEVTLNTPLQISNNLTFTNGILNSDATNLLIFEHGTTASGASNSSFVNGPVRKIGNQAFTFPVGKKGNYYGIHFYNAYRPIAISAPSNTAHHFTAEYFMQDPHPTYNHGSLDPTLTHISNCEYWILDRTNGTSNVNVTLSYSDYGSAVACSGVTNQADLRVARWNGTQWVNHGNGGTAGTPSNGTVITSAVVTAFSPFTLASANASNNPLPIELISFDAKPKENNVLLNWTTTLEINNDYFELEKSIDGFNFYSFAKINGAGNSNQVLNYSYIDKEPYSGTSYYRLKQVDFDGTYTYSDMVAINFSKDFTSNVIFYPNPSSGIINFNLPDNENILIELFDLTGKKIYAETINNNTNSINLNNFVNGIYLLSATTIDGNRLLLEKLNLIK